MSKKDSIQNILNLLLVILAFLFASIAGEFAWLVNHAMNMHKFPMQYLLALFLIFMTLIVTVSILLKILKLIKDLEDL